MHLRSVYSGGELKQSAVLSCMRTFNMAARGCIMLAESPQTCNTTKATQNSWSMTHTVCLKDRQYWSLCGCRLFSVKQGASRHCGMVGSENSLYCNCVTNAVGRRSGVDSANLYFLPVV